MLLSFLIIFNLPIFNIYLIATISIFPAFQFIVISFQIHNRGTLSTILEYYAILDISIKSVSINLFNSFDS